MTWDFRSYMPPVTQERKWRGGGFKDVHLVILSKDYGNLKDNGKIGKIREGGREEEREVMWTRRKRRKRIWNSERLGETRESQEERHKSWRGNKGKQIILKQAFISYSNFF